MITVLLEKIITILEGWIQSFTSHAQHVEDKLDSIDSTASDIETNTDPIPDIRDNTAAVITPIQNIKSNTDSIKQSSQTSTNNTTAILNNISTLSTNTGRAAAYAQDCANNTLEIKDKITTIASDTTQLRADSADLNDMSDKIYEAIKWSLVDKVITETVEGTDTVSFDTDLANDLVSLEVGIKGTQSGTGDPSPDNIRPFTGITDKYITVNGNNITINLGQTVYGGKLDVTSGLLRITKGFIEFDGSADETWQQHSSGSASNFSMKISLVHAFVSTNANISSNYLTAIPSNAAWGNYDNWLSSSSGGMLNTGIKSITDVAMWRTYLASNPLEVCYELATPIEVQLTPSQIATIKGINTIITDGNISVTYEESVKHYLDKQDN